MDQIPMHKCPKCGAQLSVERLDHNLTGQERLFCPQHGEVGSLQKTRARDYRNDQPDSNEYE